MSEEEKDKYFSKGNIKYFKNNNVIDKYFNLNNYIFPQNLTINNNTYINTDQLNNNNILFCRNYSINSSNMNNIINKEKSQFLSANNLIEINNNIVI